MYLLVVFSTLSSKYSHFMKLSGILRKSMQCLEQENRKFHMLMKKIIYSNQACFCEDARMVQYIQDNNCNKSQIDLAKKVK